MPETLRYEKDQGIARITLDRPERLNAYTDQMGAEMIAVLGEVERDETVKVLVITGAGSAFCAGADLKSANKNDILGLSVSENRAVDSHKGYFRGPAKMIKAINGLAIPTIASVPGPAVGLGCDICLACDIRIASERARFREAWIARAAISGGAGTWLLPRIVGLGMAAELLYTGRIVEADEALRIGLVNRVVPATELVAQTMELAHDIAKQAPVALKFYKTNLYKGLTLDLGTAVELIGASQAICITTRDHDEAWSAMKEKREPTYEGR